MKKAITPALLLIAVLVSGVLARPYTHLQMENLGLFLNTLDYFRNLFSEPRPLSHIAANFLIQFFNVKYLGALLEALLLTLSYLAIRKAFNKFKIPFGGLLATAAICTIWIFSAIRNDFSLIVTATAVSLLIWCISLIIKFKRVSAPKFGWISIACSIIIIIGTAIFISFNGNIERKEQWNKVEYCGMRHDWGNVIRTATPELCAQEPGMLPYALLALSYEGRLPAEMFHYPINGAESLDTEGWESLEGYFFGYLLYDCYGCVNEAMHQLFQASTYLPQGNSFCTLRQLARLCYQSGDLKLARKYCAILEKSTLHKKWVHKFVEQLDAVQADGITRAISSAEQSSVAALITHDGAFNTAALISDGLYSKPMVDRMLCALLAQRNLPAFKKLLDTQRSLYKETLPTSFRQALDILDNPMAGSDAGSNYLNYYFSGME